MPLALVRLLAQVVGIWVRWGALDKAPRWAAEGHHYVGDAVAAAACVLSGQAALQTVLAVVGLVGSLVAIAGGHFIPAEVGAWLLPAATIIVVSSIVHQLTRELGRADRERLAGRGEWRRANSALRGALTTAQVVKEPRAASSRQGRATATEDERRRPANTTHLLALVAPPRVARSNRLPAA